jgi:enediyne biosynthesis protein E2
MTTTLGSLRRLVLAPSLAEVSFAGRDFPVTHTAATRRLEAIPQSVVCGFEWGIEARDLWELERRLDLVEPELRGFAYEGATMAYTIRDAVRGGRGTRSRDLLRGPGRPHLFLAYIGIGFAMSHLPRMLWRTVVPDLSGVAYHPTVSWLAVDGYAFDKAYFDTARVVDRQQQLAPYPWQGRADYFPRASDQGIGRALWFIHGGQVPDVAAVVARFAGDRRSDLWSGVGLAATFAGGCGGADFVTLRRLACEQDPAYEAHLAQGSVFAAKARDFSGYVPEHSETATRALTDLSVAAASRLADDAVADDGAEPTGEPRYEHWRRSVRAQLRRAAADAPR